MPRTLMQRCAATMCSHDVQHKVCSNAGDNDDDENDNCGDDHNYGDEDDDIDDDDDYYECMRMIFLFHASTKAITC